MLIGFQVLGPNERFRHLSWDSLQRLNLDAVYIVCNRLDRQTERELSSRGFYCTYPDNREWTSQQAAMKEDAVRLMRYDWPGAYVLALDSDEIVSPEITRDDIEKFIRENPANRISITLHHLWNTSARYAPGLDEWRERIFRLIDGRISFGRSQTHVGLAPNYRGNPVRSPFRFWHYGLMLREDRQRKVRRYRDDGTNYYRTLRNDDRARERDVLLRLPNMAQTAAGSSAGSSS